MKATKLQVFTDSQFAGEIIRQIVHSFGEIDLRLTYDSENNNRVLIRRNFEDSAEAKVFACKTC